MTYDKIKRRLDVLVAQWLGGARMVRAVTPWDPISSALGDQLDECADRLRQILADWPAEALTEYEREAVEAWRRLASHAHLDAEGEARAGRGHPCGGNRSLRSGAMTWTKDRHEKLKALEAALHRSEWAVTDGSPAEIHADDGVVVCRSAAASSNTAAMAEMRFISEARNAALPMLDEIERLRSEIDCACNALTDSIRTWGLTNEVRHDRGPSGAAGGAGA